jgi:chromatin segregation and condensation protein Rec8/ScpA/Scc1 (kleisin family)
LAASQLPLSAVRKDQENFVAYCQSVAARAPDDQLLFSDVVPIADSAPQVAAKGFYNLLSLATNKRLTVRQADAYAEIEIVILPSTQLPPRLYGNDTTNATA